MRRAAFDKGYAAACLGAELAAARFLLSSKERLRRNDGLDTVERRMLLRTAIILDVGHRKCLHAVRRLQTRLVRGRGKTPAGLICILPCRPTAGQGKSVLVSLRESIIPLSK